MIAIAPLPADQTQDVLHLELQAWQQGFVHPISQMVQEINADVDFHIIRKHDQVVGFFKTDRAYDQAHEFAKTGELGLRGFLIGAQFQKQGIGRATMAALPRYLRKIYPDQPTVVLTVNCKNPAALRAYLGGGFRDEGEIYHGGNAGAQHILRLALPEPA